MLICICCNKTIANTDPHTVRYGGCSACDLKEVAKLMEEKKRKDLGEFGVVEIINKPQSENPWDYIGKITIGRQPRVDTDFEVEDLEEDEQVINVFDKNNEHLCWFVTDGKQFFAPIFNDDFRVDTFDEAIAVLFKDFVFPEILATSPCSPYSGYETGGA